MIISGFSILTMILMFKFGTVRGKFNELLTPSVKMSSLKKSKLTLEQQRELYLKFEYEICQAFVPCANSTLTGNSENIFVSCTIAKKKLAKISISPFFPDDVAKNMKLFLTSMEHSMTRSVNQWEVHRNGRMGESLMSSIKNWEIETCAYNSVPQKMRRIYGIDKLAAKKIVTCDDINQIYSNSTLSK